MNYTLLRVIDPGVVLFDEHRRRFEGDPGALAAFDAFAAEAKPGIYSLTWSDKLEVRQVDKSRLEDGQQVRFKNSPAKGFGVFPKPGPHGIYSSVRTDGITTLLTGKGGGELWESCVAAVVGWSGTEWICVPADRPRVRSTAEAHLRKTFSFAEKPLPVRDDATPLLLLNAVKGTAEVAIPGRPAFPTGPRQQLDQALWATAKR